MTTTVFAVDLDGATVAVWSRREYAVLHMTQLMEPVLKNQDGVLTKEDDRLQWKGSRGTRTVRVRQFLVDSAYLKRAE